ncbi:zinc finger MYND domain-containing protein 11 [Acyrthosiphon pisum]|uniref:Zinc finger MYND domain-containing protein 11 n=1 Tax=Acyrthosiphon pisum TaxID=7029 RepID=A0A8R2FDA6_ACYPI|nr:zinc finger MYND domain-containing protein 11 [Acyrthosiphon pisum]|eukprot:XP_008187263.1 PREDICTED: zinc finger MYND domain-containing protein 11 [Acyrthosiphon pisum]
MNKKLFMAMSRRRISCPLAVQQLWDAVKVIRFQRQVPDIDRITKYMTKVHNMSPEEVGRQLNYCVRDGLLILTKRVGNKGSKAGVETEGYKLPEEKAEKDSHDWYCFQCHSAGDVISCTSCYRVFHLSCIEKKDLPENDVKHKFICNICKNCASTKEASKKIKKSQLNRLLYHTTGRLREKIPLPWSERKIATTAPSTYVSDRLQFQSQLKGSDLHFNMKCALKDKDPWRIDLLIFKIIDLQMIEDKADDDEYKNVEEFRADILTFVHNIIIFHGVHSSLADYGRLMLRDCNRDLDEIMRCRYCYKYSIQKNSKFWFCKPCKPPHELVYAKQEDFPYWPAKVLKIEGDMYEVRFFGSEHQLGIIDKSQIRPISVNIHTLQSQGRTSQWNKACEELRRHQLQLDKVIFGLAAQSSSSSSSSSSEDEEESLKLKLKVSPILKRYERRKVKEQKISIKTEAKVETDTEESESKDEVKPVKRKRGRPLSLEKKISPPKKVVKKSLLIKKSSPENSVEKRPRGRPRKVIEPVIEDSTPVKQLKTKVKSTKENTNASEGIKTSKNASPLKTKSPVKETEVDENITSTTERLKDPDVVEDETVSSSCQDLVRSVKVQTKPISKKPPKSYINKIRAEMESEKRKAIEQLIEQHKEEISLLQENHNIALSEVKKKQWCVNCESEAIYHCCWNTAYCSPKCQLIHWSSEHKRHCRRKR